MRGLGLANPEARKAQVLAQLNGSTAIPNPRMPPPIDSALAGAPTLAPSQTGPTPAPVPIDMPVPQRPAPQPAAPAEGPTMDPTGQGAGKMPKWAKIASAIGHIMLSADAGYNGRAMPRVPEELDPAREQDQDMQVAEFLVNTTARAWEVSRKAPPGVREPMLQQFRKAIQTVAPDFDFDGFMDGLQTDADKVDQLAPDLATLSEEGKRMFMARVRTDGGDADAASGAMKDEKFMRGLFDYEDSRNAQSVRMKIAEMNQARKRAGLPDDAFADATMDGLRQFNDNLPERFRLSPSEMATIKRNPAYQKALGMTTPDAAEQQTLDSRAGVQRPPQQEPVARPSSAPPVAPPTPATASSKAPARKRPQAQPPAAPPREPAPGVLDDLGRAMGADVPPARKPPAPPKAAKPPAAPQGQRFTVPKNMTIPGVGPVKKGDTVIYDQATGKYRRG